MGYLCPAFYNEVRAPGAGGRGLVLATRNRPF